MGVFWGLGVIFIEMVGVIFVGGERGIGILYQLIWGWETAVWGRNGTETMFWFNSKATPRRFAPTTLPVYLVKFHKQVD